MSKETRQFEADELAEFLEFCEENDIEVDEEDGEYSAFSPESEMRVAYFNATPSDGSVPGGWARNYTIGQSMAAAINSF